MPSSAVPLRFPATARPRGPAGGRQHDIRRRGLPLWLPWIAAPVFMLLPIGGCGVADAVQRGGLAAVPPRPVGKPAAAGSEWRMAALDHRPPVTSHRFR